MIWKDYWQWSWSLCFKRNALKIGIPDWSKKGYCLDWRNRSNSLASVAQTHQLLSQGVFLSVTIDTCQVYV